MTRLSICCLSTRLQCFTRNQINHATSTAIERSQMRNKGPKWRRAGSFRRHSLAVPVASRSPFSATCHYRPHGIWTTARRWPGILPRRPRSTRRDRLAAGASSSNLRNLRNLWIESGCLLFDAPGGNCAISGGSEVNLFPLRSIH